MSRRRLLAANWKMNLTVSESVGLAQTLLKTVARLQNIDVVVCPSFVSLSPVGKLLEGSPIALGAQDLFWMEQGAFTGQISPVMLTDVGCSYCIVGHSERRGRFGSAQVAGEQLPYFADTDATVNLKLLSAFSGGLSPILCVGENAEERRQGRAEKVVKTQITEALQGLDAAKCGGMAVAYEPVWAIGTGNVCGGDEANRMCSLIREHLSSVFPDASDDSIRVIYGGSVKAENCRDILKQSEIDGALVGGASLDPEEFAHILLCE